MHSLEIELGSIYMFYYFRYICIPFEFRKHLILIHIRVTSPPLNSRSASDLFSPQRLLYLLDKANKHLSYSRKLKASNTRSYDVVTGVYMTRDTIVLPPAHIALD
jgi:hypothetical protein